MKVVILTPIPFWHPGTQELVENLKDDGVNVRALDIFNARTLDENGIQHDCTPSFLRGILGKIYIKLIRRSLISKYLNAGDIADIHFVEPAYGRYVQAIKNRQVKLISTLFGSDLFRSTDEQKKLQAPIFESSDAINLSENMIPYFERHFPGFHDKFRLNQYGSQRLDIIDRLDCHSNKKLFREKYGVPAGKTVVSCGYNAKREQQHLKMLDEIARLPGKDKTKLFLLLSMTYGGEEAGADYVAAIKSRLAEMKISYLCLENRLTDEEIAEIRIISDITINIQTTDALASSIKEAMTAGDVMIIGEWLPYEIYKNLGVFYVPTALENLSGNLAQILSNLNEFSEKSKNNKQIILNFASWKVLIKSWINVYKEV